MQFQVPQFIEAEDKIVGPFSLRQFAYVGIGGIISAIIYFFAQTWLWAIASFFIFAIAFGLAFVKIEGRPLMNVVISAFHFYWKPQTYVWQPEHPVAKLPEKKATAEAEKSALEDILAKAEAKPKTPIIVHSPIISHEAIRHEVESHAAAAAAPHEPVEQPHETVAKHEVAPVEQPKHQDTKPEARPVSRATVSTGSALHKSWEDLQTGAAFAKKNSDKQFLEKKMSERYQIFQKLAGDRNAAKRVDYR